jgi:hypothetical protein
MGERGEIHRRAAKCSILVIKNATGLSATGLYIREHSGVPAVNVP